MIVMDSQLSNQVNEGNESSPLLQHDHHRLQSGRLNIWWGSSMSNDSALAKFRGFLNWFLTSKYGHYFVIILVALDVTGIFANFLIALHICEHGNKGENVADWRQANAALGVLSLVFSSVFMAELLCSVFAFGLNYFKSAFHVFDSLSILASFLVDVLTRGPLEEAGSLVIVLRLFRVFKIIEESGTAAEEAIGEMQKNVDRLERENSDLRQRQTFQR